APRLFPPLLLLVLVAPLRRVADRGRAVRVAVLLQLPRRLLLRPPPQLLHLLPHPLPQPAEEPRRPRRGGRRPVRRPVLRPPLRPRPGGVPLARLLHQLPLDQP